VCDTQRTHDERTHDEMTHDEQYATHDELQPDTWMLEAVVTTSPHSHLPSPLGPPLPLLSVLAASSGDRSEASDTASGGDLLRAPGGMPARGVPLPGMPARGVPLPLDQRDSIRVHRIPHAASGVIPAAAPCSSLVVLHGQATTPIHAQTLQDTATHMHRHTRAHVHAAAQAGPEADTVEAEVELDQALSAPFLDMAIAASSLPQLPHVQHPQHEAPPPTPQSGSQGHTITPPQSGRRTHNHAQGSGSREDSQMLSLAFSRAAGSTTCTTYY